MRETLGRTGDRENGGGAGRRRRRRKVKAWQAGKRGMESKSPFTEYRRVPGFCPGSPGSPRGFGLVGSPAGAAGARSAPFGVRFSFAILLFVCYCSTRLAPRGPRSPSPPSKKLENLPPLSPLRSGFQIVAWDFFQMLVKGKLRELGNEIRQGRKYSKIR